MKKIFFTPIYITLIYAAFSYLWIVLSDSAIESLGLPEAVYTSIQTFKGLIFVSLTSLLIYFLINRSYNTQKHLNSVLAVIRDVNQLIVRQKDIKKLIKESCEILTSNHVYENACIVLYDEFNNAKYCEGIGGLKEFSKYREKVLSNWTPLCIEKLRALDTSYIFLPNNSKECEDCIIAPKSSDKLSFCIELKHSNKVYGYLNLWIDKKYINDVNEISLLKEVAGDIAYALSNIENEEQILELKNLYDNVINSVDNIIFVKDKKLNYIACNSALEKFLNKPKNEIIGKNDYEIFDKEHADFFRKNDKEIFKTKQIQTYTKKAVYPDGRKSYMYTVRSALLNKDKNIIGVVGNTVDITELYEAQEAMKISEEKFEKAFNHTPNIIMISSLATGEIYDVNNTFEQILGYKKDDIIGKKTTDIDLWYSIEDRTSYINTFRQNSSVKGNTYKFLTKDKKIVLVRVFANLVKIDNKEYVLAIGEDITQMHENLLLIQQKKRELETIIQEAPNPIIIHNEAGKIILINKVFKELTGYEYEQIDTIDKWLELAYGENKVSVKKHLQKLYSIDKNVYDGEYTIKTKDKKEIVWQFSSAPIGVIDGSRTIVSSAMDITELKQKDEMLIVQSRHAAMGEMISMIAHQWRQPLSVISMDANNMLLDIALDDFNDKKAQRVSKNIIEQTEHLSKTIDDFRNFFKPDKETSIVDISKIIQETYYIVKDSLNNHNVEFETNYESEYLTIKAYHRELMQVFVNIINNAKDVLVENNVKKSKINVKVYSDQKYVNVEICDNGGGIDKSIIDRIFEPYFTTKDEKSGTGLGLYMSKMIIENHLKGFIKAYNTQNGACFRISLLKYIKE